MCRLCHDCEIDEFRAKRMWKIIVILKVWGHIPWMLSCTSSTPQKNQCSVVKNIQRSSSRLRLSWWFQFLLAHQLILAKMITVSAGHMMDLPMVETRTSSLFVHYSLAPENHSKWSQYLIRHQLFLRYASPNTHFRLATFQCYHAKSPFSTSCCPYHMLSPCNHFWRTLLHFHRPHRRYRERV